MSLSLPTQYSPRGILPDQLGRSVGASLKMVMRLRRLPEHPLQKLLRDLSDRALFAAHTVHHSNGNVLGDISRPAFGGVKRDHPQRMRILTAQDVVDDGRFVRRGFVSFDISAAK